MGVVVLAFMNSSEHSWNKIIMNKKIIKKKYFVHLSVIDNFDYYFIVEPLSPCKPQSVAGGFGWVLRS